MSNLVTNPAACHDKVVNQQFAACSGSPHDDNHLTSLVNVVIVMPLIPKWPISGSLYYKLLSLCMEFCTSKVGQFSINHKAEASRFELS